MEILKNTNNALRFLLEVAAIVAIAYWGLTLRSFGAWRYAVAIGLSLDDNFSMGAVGRANGTFPVRYNPPVAS